MPPLHQGLGSPRRFELAMSAICLCPATLLCSTHGIFHGFCFERWLVEMTMDARHGGPARRFCQDVDGNIRITRSLPLRALAVCRPPGPSVRCRDVTWAFRGP